MNDDQKAIRVDRALRTPTYDDPALVHLHASSDENGPCACGAKPPGKAKTVAREEFWPTVTCPDCKEGLKEKMAERVDKKLTRGRW